MSVAAPQVGLAGILIIAWSSQASATDHNCSQCTEVEQGPSCDTETGLCVEGCQPGWFGKGCNRSCENEKQPDDKGCEVVCNCLQDCETCDTQNLECRQDKCMASSPSHSNNGNRVEIIASVSGAILLVGIVFLIFMAWRKSSSTTSRIGRPRGLRGTVLGHQCCARCPALRDMLQRVGTTMHLPGFQLGARDSLDTFEEEDEMQGMSFAMRTTMTRYRRPVVGVRTDSGVAVHSSATSGYKWKKKWRDRRERSKQKRKMKHAERKKMREMGESGMEPHARDRTGSILLPAIGHGMGGRRTSMFTTSLFSRRASVSPNEAAKNAAATPVDAPYHARIAQAQAQAQTQYSAQYAAQAQAQAQASAGSSRRSSNSSLTNPKSPVPSTSGYSARGVPGGKDENMSQAFRQASQDSEGSIQGKAGSPGSSSDPEGTSPVLKTQRTSVALLDTASLSSLMTQK